MINKLVDEMAKSSFDFKAIFLNKGVHMMLNAQTNIPFLCSKKIQIYIWAWAIYIQRNIFLARY
jgi:hypothetical protein